MENEEISAANFQQALEDIRQIDEVLESDDDDYSGSDVDVDEKRETDDDLSGVPSVRPEAFSPKPLSTISSSLGEVPGSLTGLEVESDTDVDVSKEQLLFLNQQYQEYVAANLARVRKALERNRELQHNKLNARRKDISGLVYNRFRAPYFKDDNRLSPPENVDTKSIRQVGYPVPTNPGCSKPWSKSDLENLKEGVKADGLERFMAPLLNHREVFEKRLKKATDDADRAGRKELIREIREIDKQLLNLKRLPEAQVLGHKDREVDWRKVANRHLDGTRTVWECQVKWSNEAHPSINHNWSNEDYQNLEVAAAAHNYSDWNAIANELGMGHTAFECFQRYQQKLNVGLYKRSYSSAEDKLIKELVNKFRVGKFVPWMKVAYFLQDRKPCQVAWRWENKLDPSLKTGKWSPEEDEILLRGVRRQGDDVVWVKLAMEIEGRTSLQCRNRYKNSLSPDIRRGRFSSMEDLLLLNAIKKCGIGYWAKVTSLLEKDERVRGLGRNNHMYYHRYRYLASRQIKKERVTFDELRRKEKQRVLETEMASVKGGSRMTLLGFSDSQTFEEYLHKMTMSKFLDRLIQEAKDNVERLDRQAWTHNISNVNGMAYMCDNLRPGQTPQPTAASADATSTAASNSAATPHLAADTETITQPPLLKTRHHRSALNYLREDPAKWRPDPQEATMMTLLTKAVFPSTTLKPMAFFERDSKVLRRRGRADIVMSQLDAREPLSWTTAMSVLMVSVKIDFQVCRGILYRDARLPNISFLGCHKRPLEVPSKSRLLRPAAPVGGSRNNKPFQLVLNNPEKPGVGEMVSGSIIGHLPAPKVKAPPVLDIPTPASKPNRALYVIKTEDGRLLLVSASGTQTARQNGQSTCSQTVMQPNPLGNLRTVAPLNGITNTSSFAMNTAASSAVNAMPSSAVNGMVSSVVNIGQDNRPGLDSGDVTVSEGSITTSPATEKRTAEGGKVGKSTRQSSRKRKAPSRFGKSAASDDLLGIDDDSDRDDVSSGEWCGNEAESAIAPFEQCSKSMLSAMLIAANSALLPPPTSVRITPVAPRRILPSPVVSRNESAGFFAQSSINNVDTPRPLPGGGNFLFPKVGSGVIFQANAKKLCNPKLPEVGENPKIVVSVKPVNNGAVVTYQSIEGKTDPTNIADKSAPGTLQNAISNDIEVLKMIDTKDSNDTTRATIAAQVTAPDDDQIPVCKSEVSEGSRDEEAMSLLMTCATGTVFGGAEAGDRGRSPVKVGVLPNGSETCDDVIMQHGTDDENLGSSDAVGSSDLGSNGVGGTVCTIHVTDGKNGGSTKCSGDGLSAIDDQCSGMDTDQKEPFLEEKSSSTDQVIEPVSPVPSGNTLVLSRSSRKRKKSKVKDTPRKKSKESPRVSLRRISAPKFRSFLELSTEDDHGHSESELKEDVSIKVEEPCTKGVNPTDSPSLTGPSNVNNPLTPSNAPSLNSDTGIGIPPCTMESTPSEATPALKQPQTFELTVAPTTKIVLGQDGAVLGLLISGNNKAVQQSIVPTSNLAVLPPLSNQLPQHVSSSIITKQEVGTCSPKGAINQHPTSDVAMLNGAVAASSQPAAGEFVVSANGRETPSVVNGTTSLVEQSPIGTRAQTLNPSLNTAPLANCQPMTIILNPLGLPQGSIVPNLPQPLNLSQPINLPASTSTATSLLGPLQSKQSLSNTAGSLITPSSEIIGSSTATRAGSTSSSAIGLASPQLSKVLVDETISKLNQPSVMPMNSTVPGSPARRHNKKGLAIQSPVRSSPRGALNLVAPSPLRSLLMGQKPPSWASPLPSDVPVPHQLSTPCAAVPPKAASPSGLQSCTATETAATTELGNQSSQTENLVISTSLESMETVTSNPSSDANEAQSEHIVSDLFPESITDMPTQQVMNPQANDTAVVSAMRGSDGTTTIEPSHQQLLQPQTVQAFSTITELQVSRQVQIPQSIILNVTRQASSSTVASPSANIVTIPAAQNGVGVDQLMIQGNALQSEANIPLANIPSSHSPPQELTNEHLTGVASVPQEDNSPEIGSLNIPSIEVCNEAMAVQDLRSSSPEHDMDNNKLPNVSMAEDQSDAVFKRPFPQPHAPGSVKTRLVNTRTKKPLLPELMKEDLYTVDMDKLKEFSTAILGIQGGQIRMGLLPPNLSTLFSFKHLLIKKDTLEESADEFSLTRGKLRKALGKTFTAFHQRNSEMELVSKKEFLSKMRRLPEYRLFMERFTFLYLWPALLSILNPTPRKQKREYDIVPMREYTRRKRGAVQDGGAGEEGDKHLSSQFESRKDPEAERSNEEQIQAAEGGSVAAEERGDDTDGGERISEGTPQAGDDLLEDSNGVQEDIPPATNSEAAKGSVLRMRRGLVSTKAKRPHRARVPAKPTRRGTRKTALRKITEDPEMKMQQVEEETK